MFLYRSLIFGIFCMKTAAKLNMWILNDQLTNLPIGSFASALNIEYFDSEYAAECFSFIN